MFGELKPFCPYLLLRAYVGAKLALLVGPTELPHEHYVFLVESAIVLASHENALLAGPCPATTFLLFWVVY